MKANKTACSLYADKKGFCNEFNVKISTRKTTMKHTNKIGYMIGTRVKLASPKCYIEELSESLKRNIGSIDISKECTCEKGK